MKFIFTKDNGPARILKVSMANTLNHFGHDTIIIDKTDSLFDLFHTFKPDVFFGSVEELDKTTNKVLDKYEDTNVILNYNDTKTKNDSLLNRPYKVGSFYGWRENSLSFEFGSDTIELDKAKGDSKYESQLFYVGEYKQEKIHLFEKYLLPLIYPNTNLNVKIIGAGNYPSVAHLGVANENLTVANMTVNTKLLLNLSESPYVNFRVYQGLYAKTPVASNYNEFTSKSFRGNEVAMFDDMKGLASIIIGQDKTDVEAGYEFATQNTMIHRIHELVNYLGLEIKLA